MRTFENDVLLICKGWYSNQWNSKFDAVKAYQAKWAESNAEYITDDNVLDFMFMVVETILTAKDYLEMWKRIRWWYWINNVNNKTLEITPRYIVDAFIIQLEALRVKDDGKWLIDLSDYEDVKEVI